VNVKQKQILKNCFRIVLVLIFFALVSTVKASTSVTHTSESDWSGGITTSIDITTSPGDVVLDYSTTSTTTQTTASDFSGVYKNNIDLTTVSGNFQLESNYFAFGEYGVEIPDTGADSVTESLAVEAVTDGADGAFFYQFKDDGAGNRDLRIWRVDNDGQEIWGNYPVVDSPSFADTSGMSYSVIQEIKMIPDGAGGVIIIWNYDDRDSEYDMYAQRIDADGNQLWGDNGVAITTTTASSYEEYLMNIGATIDDNGDPVILYDRFDSDETSQTRTTEISKLNLSDGSMQWNETLYTFQDNPLNSYLNKSIIISDNNGGTLAFWDGNSNDGARAQRVDTDGNVLWTAGGEVLSDDPSEDKIATVLSVPNDEFLFFVTNYNYSGSGLVTANKIDLDANKIWGADVNIMSTNEDEFSAIADGEGGAVVIGNQWQGQKYVTNRIDNDGNLLWGNYDSPIEQKVTISSSWYSENPNYGLINYRQARDWAYLDGNGNVTVTFVDGWPSVYQVYAQNIDISDGSLNWGEDGTNDPQTSIINFKKQNYNPRIVKTSDGALVFFAESNLIGNVTFGYPDYFGVQKISDTEGYYWDGEIISTSIDSGSSDTDWQTLSAEATIPADSSITWETRTSNYPNLALTSTPSTTGDGWGSSAYISYVKNNNYEVENILTYSIFWDLWAQATDLPQSVDFALADTSNVGYVVVRSIDGAIPTDYTIQTCQTCDGSDWSTQATISGNSNATIETEFTPVSANSVRVAITDADGFYSGGTCEEGDCPVILEVEIYAANTFSAWQEVNDGNIQSPDGRYIQYRATVDASSDNTVTPSVSSVTFTGERTAAIYSPSGTYTSSVINSGGTDTTWDSLSSNFTLNSSSTLSISTRTGDTATPDGAWTGWSEAISLGGDNLAPDGTATATSEINPAYLAGQESLLGTAVSAIDEDENTIWLTGDSTPTNEGENPQVLEIDFGSDQTVGYVKIQSMNASGLNLAPRDYTIETWNQELNDGAGDWVIQETVEGNTTVTSLGYEFTPVITSKVRISITEGNMDLVGMIGYDLCGIAELEIYESNPDISATTSASATLSATAQYLQYKIDLGTSDTDLTPSVSDVTVEYTSATPSITDTDSDGIADDSDNCPTIANADQADDDGDGIGNVCEADSDSDGVIDDSDNCPLDYNPDQDDDDDDGKGDKCDNDQDDDDDDDEDTNDDEEEVITETTPINNYDDEDNVPPVDDTTPDSPYSPTIPTRPYTPIIDITDKEDISTPFKLLKESIVKVGSMIYPEHPAIGVTNTVAAALPFVPAAASLGNLFNFPIWFKESLFRILGVLGMKRRKKKQWGIVFNVSNGQPISFAKVEVIDNQTNKIKESKLTDKNGAYFFLAEPGSYRLRITKNGYRLANVTSRSEYYYGNTYTEKDVLRVRNTAVINQNIPLIQFKANRWEFLTKGTFLTIITILFWAGFLFNLYLFITYPTILNTIIFLAYSFIASLKIAYVSHPTLGVVRNKQGKAYSFASIKVLDQDTKELVARTITDQHGRYFMMLYPGNYSIQFSDMNNQLITQKNVTFKDQGVFSEGVVG
jgi:hypothetical protein